MRLVAVRRGISLLEAVVGLFLLVCAVLAVIVLVHSGLRHTARTQRLELATQIAERKLEEMRAWAASRQGAGYGFDDWSSHTGPARPDPVDPRFQVQVNVRPWTLAANSSAIESLYPAAEQIRLSRSALEVRVTVDRVSLTALIGEPDRGVRASPIELTPEVAPPPMLPRDASLTWRAEAYDADNRPLRDVTFQWYVRPGTGNGNLQQTRDGRTCVFTNRLDREVGPPIYTGGQVVLEARARYFGRELLGQSISFALQGPPP